ncbi:pilus assembly protein [Massilia sp. IC2-278]|uniref:TadE/TadG family type IV pilus assembly protein n=1 Tax=Massilia sp. IC2-278 TaxID=2887200 RepID=UPI001E3B4FBE|nr:TadE/TadG family type IV pilus assembly protein [Massilia sp. IC2-278]MCC2960746.1 pilus assembly protein [Massilia sp. IC2-278]
MMRRFPLPRQRGLAAVEFALVLPLLMLLLFGMIDAARALQANIIMVNIGREGANLVARGGTQLETGSQDIIYALMASAPPLNVQQRGMVYITRVMGVTSGGASRSVVVDQYRWDDAARNLGYRASGYAPASRIFACPAWNAGLCSGINSKNRPASAVMDGKLGDGEVVYVVETFYKFDMFMTSFSMDSLSLPTIGPDLYSMTVF